MSFKCDPEFGCGKSVRVELNPDRRLVPARPVRIVVERYDDPDHRLFGNIKREVNVCSRCAEVLAQTAREIREHLAKMNTAGNVPFATLEEAVYATMGLEGAEAMKDIHAERASDELGIPIDLVSVEQRAVGKALNFGELYGTKTGRFSHMDQNPNGRDES